MGRNLHCNCPCHGSDGNVTDAYFCCKNCYAANHMGGLPRQSHEDAPRPKGKKGGPKGKRTDKHDGHNTAQPPARPAGSIEAIKEGTKRQHGEPVRTQSGN